MKKTVMLAVILIVVLAFLWCAIAMAETRGTDGNITWILSDDGLLTISGTGPMNSYSNRYDENGSVITTAPWGVSATSLVIVDGVTSIGNYAFYGCSSLTSVTIPSSVTNILDGVFKHCTSLTSITIPGSVKKINYGLVERCNALQTVIIEEGVQEISSYAFSYCENLSSITIPNSVTSISSSALSGSNNCIIKGSTGSAAETFANENDFTFVATARGSCGDNLQWSLNDLGVGVLFISGSGEMNSAPWKKTDVTSVIISDGVISMMSGS